MSSEINELRAFKRNGPFFFYRNVEIDYKKDGIVEYEKEQIVNPLYHKLVSSKIHVPMKKESKEIRKIMSRTGLKESEIREKETYRKKIADVVKEKSILSKEDKLFLKIMKENGNLLKKPIWDEEVIKNTKEYLENIVLDYLSDKPYHVYYCECCNERHKETYSIEEYFLYNKDVFMEANLLRNLYALNHNNIVKKYMILVKKYKKKV